MAAEWREEKVKNGEQKKGSNKKANNVSPSTFMRAACKVEARE